MTRLLFAAALAAAFAVAGAPGVAKAQTATDWNQTYSQTSTGYRVGDPQAPLQLIEFISYTCVHCARYAQLSEGALRLGYVGEGKAAVEVRPFIRNPVDLAATLTTLCGTPERFFDRHRTMLLAHDAFMAKLRAATQGQQLRWRTGTFGQQMQAIANDLDFYQIMEPQGIGEAQLDRCLNDAAQAEAITAASQASRDEFAVPGTPSFALNGALLEGVHTWDRLEPLLANGGIDTGGSNTGASEAAEPSGS